MRPWLLNILACPICKHDPLDTYFFKWETPEDDLRIIFEQSGIPSKFFLKNYHHLIHQIYDGTITLKPIQKIWDETDNSISKALLEKVLQALERVIKFKLEGKSMEEVLKGYRSEIDDIYRYLNLIEIEDGLLVCEKCSRWYPIGSSVSSIPEMLPDNLREKEKDMNFLKKWENKIPKKVLEQGKPFNMKNK